MRAAAIILFVLSLGMVVEEQQPQFRTSITRVRIEVSVTDERGPMRGLSPADFSVYDNRERQVVDVEESGDAPLDLVLVAEPLASVAYLSPEQAPRVAAALTAFFAQVDARDRLAALVAGTPPTRVRTLQNGPLSFDARAFTSGEYAAPFDAVVAGLGEFVQTDRQSALVVFTNAADFRSTVSFEALTEIARRLGPAFVLVGHPVAISEQARVRSAIRSGSIEMPAGDRVEAAISGYVFPARLQLLARRTGGIAVNLADGEPEQVIAAMFTWLRTRYTISYEPPPGKGWHAVTVRVNRRGATVRAREGYVVN